MKITSAIIATSLFLSLPVLAGAGDGSTKTFGPNWGAYNGFCLEFVSINKPLVTSLIRDMENSKLPIEDYLMHSDCQPKKYSTSVQSPMLHYIVEDPSNRQEFLNVFWRYYSIKRKEPEIFDKIINVKNSLGETMLDYTVSIEERDLYSDEALNGPLDTIVAMLCEHGGVYATRKDRKCP